MAANRNNSRFEVDEDLDYQRTEWRIEHIGWIVWTLIIAAAFAGLLGSGPLSSAHAASPNRDLIVDYDRIGRRRADSDIIVRVAPQLARSGVVRLRTTSNLVEFTAMQGIQPEPRETLHEGAVVTHVFAASSAGAPLAIRFRLQPDKVGRHDYAFAIESGSEVRLSILILP